MVNALISGKPITKCHHIEPLMTANTGSNSVITTRFIMIQHKWLGRSKLSSVPDHRNSLCWIPCQGLLKFSSLYGCKPMVWDQPTKCQILSVFLKEWFNFNFSRLGIIVPVVLCRVVPFTNKSWFLVFFLISHGTFSIPSYNLFNFYCGAQLVQCQTMLLSNSTLPIKNCTVRNADLNRLKVLPYLKSSLIAWL